MSRLSDLIQQVKINNPQVGEDLERELRALSARRAFGLNFERHRPEAVELPQRAVRKGDKVRLLTPRRKIAKDDPRVWLVKQIDTLDGIRVGHIELRDTSKPEKKIVPMEDLVVVSEFRDPIFPGLTPTGKVERDLRKPFHSVINGENYHVLKALTFTHRRKIDAIYIDPPYNTGAKDWKYNNDYVEAEDLYRHSKWLAFMERRLKLASDLLNPDDSVLIVTIDEKEVHRLGLLLEQVFPEGKSQMITITINHRGVARNKEFTRVDEYAFFVFFGNAGPTLTIDDMLTLRADLGGESEPVRWERLIKGSNNSRRIDRPNLFYPVFVDPEDRNIVQVGDSVPPEVDWTKIVAPSGTVAVWPLGRDGTEKRWQIAPTTLRSYVEQGIAKVGSYDRKNNRWTILYLNRGQRDRIERGEIEITGRDHGGVLQLRTVTRPQRAAMTVWNRPAHNAGYYGSGIVGSLLPGRKFPFPKSLYAVEDSLRFAVGRKPDATVLDFFSGSGTTAHAVMRLNRQDGGRRQCILVTNNEVAAEEQVTLRSRGLRPGDAEWEQWGICDLITKPRVESAITGRTPSGSLVAGHYKFVDEFPISEGFQENAEFFTLTYESPLAVGHNRAFARIAPLLWMRAGSSGRRIDTLPSSGWEVTEAYGLLIDLDQAAAFCEAVADGKGSNLAYIVTNDDGRYQSVVRRLPDGVEPVRLYESYLTNFCFANEV